MKARLRLRPIQLQVPRFVWLSSFIHLPPRASAPGLCQLAHNPLYRPRIVLFWSEVPSFTSRGSIRAQRFCHGNVAAQRLQNMLPGADCMWVANANWTLIDERADNVGHKPSLCPVAPTYHVACAYGGNCNSVATIIGRVEE